MRQFILSTLILSILFIGVSTLYVFKLPPFSAFNETTNQNNKNSILNSDNSATIDDKEQKDEKNPTYHDHLKKGDLLKENNYYTLAINEYTQASRLEPDKIEPWLKIGQIHLKVKAYPKAIETFLEINKKFPQNIEAKINLLKSYIQAKNFEKAREYASSIQSENQTAYYYKALVNAFFDNYEEAEKNLKKAVEINSVQEITKKSQDFLRAFEQINKAEGLQNEYILTLIAKNFNLASEYTLAIEKLIKVTQTMPEYRDAWILLGYAQLHQEEYLTAIKSLENALNLDTEKPEIRYLLGLAYFGVDNYLEAITHLEIALQNSYEPKIHIYQKLAEMYLMTKDYKSALNNYEKALELKDEAVDYYIRPIWILADHLKSPNRCIKLANQAIKNHSDEGMSFNLLGWCQLAKNDNENAKINFQKAINMNPDLGAAYLNLGKLYKLENDLDKAKENFKKAFELSEGSSIGNLAATLYNEILDFQKKEINSKT